MMKECLRCRATFASFKNKRYCDSECARLALNARQRAERAPHAKLAPDRVCVVCDTPLTGRARKHCSDDCLRATERVRIEGIRRRKGVRTREEMVADLAAARAARAPEVRQRKLEDLRARANTDAERARKREYYRANRDDFLERSRRWRANNPEGTKAQYQRSRERDEQVRAEATESGLRWTEAEDAFLLTSDHLTRAEQAAVLGRTVRGVRDRIERLTDRQ